MSKIDIKEELRAHIARKYKRQHLAAKAWGVSASMVSLVLKGDREPSDIMLADAGFERIQAAPAYVRVKK